MERDEKAAAGIFGERVVEERLAVKLALKHLGSAVSHSGVLSDLPSVSAHLIASGLQNHVFSSTLGAKYMASRGHFFSLTVICL